MTERIVRMTAKELAAADWDSGEHSTRFRKVWPRVKVFVGRNWPAYVKAAREMLVAQLNDKSTPLHLKDIIAEALIKDREESFYGINTKVGYSTTHTLNPEHPGRREKKIFYDN